MVFHKIARFVKNISFMLLAAQGEFLKKRLVKKLGYDPKTFVKGCSVEITQEEQAKREKIEDDIRAVLKKYKNNPEEIANFFENTLGVKVYRVKNVKKVLKRITEEDGLITERTGFRALRLNWITKQKLRLKTETMVLTDLEPDIYLLINSLHKWYIRREGFPGFDEKSQRLLKKFNKKNVDKLMKKLSIKEIQGLRDAIQRDVQAIEFVEDYAKKNQGAKKALEKMQSDNGANL
ncbi:MAG: hypothetical protein K6E29_06970 [Cyanobacteria bacterium RUI128]|nr:hypothetical protein [Cyanobacteria bacterium RUI128]